MQSDKRFAATLGGITAIINQMVGSFGGSQDMGTERVNSVSAGTKRATASLMDGLLTLGPHHRDGLGSYVS
jgi:hypothetical protein